MDVQRISTWRRMAGAQTMMGDRRQGRGVCRVVREGSVRGGG